ncbi:hypothetical protein WK81_27170 [Burkholderia ubonensis]|uniref:hypothetical protein n=1 Tax=Burkholderia ubonensis TaxID=101571 RepID=UPI000759182E|nr:hypothetical protein [Burkholderia ubonensis]KVV36262.1 hypothetical protein WK81_27170 [Burkholderia ubonensis]
MDANTKFLAPEAVRATFEIVRRAIQSNRPKRTLTPVEVNADKAIAIFLFCAGFGFASLLCLYMIHHFWPTPVLATLALGVAISVEIASLLSLIAVVIQAIPMLNRIRKKPVGPILELASVDIDRLLPYCNDLMRFSLPELAYVREHISHQRDAFDNRRGRLIGQLDKVGTFPALATLGISVVKLMQDQHIALNNSIIWTIAGSLAAFYLLSLLLADTSDKLTQAIGLLNFVIDNHPEKGNDE